MAEEDPSPLLIAITIAMLAVFGLAIILTLWTEGLFVPVAIFVAVFSGAVYGIRRWIIKSRDADERLSTGRARD